MENNKRITEIMKRHHQKILQTLTDFENELKSKNQEKIEVFFGIFKDNLEKHFMLEESVLFRFNEKINDKKLEISMALTREHQTMLNMIKIMESDVKNGAVIDDISFRKMHLDHINVEDMVFYPELDLVLSEEEKDNVLKIIRAI